MKELTRINKYISETGLCSRREADRLVASGVVTVNGQRAEMGTKVCDDDKILINQRPLLKKRKRVYLAFHKPPGITCTTDLKDKTNIIEFIHYHERIFPIGRLDKMSEGLIFLTNDGDIVNKILRAGNNHEKEYMVTVNRPI
ncbi:MAG: 23S rRNA pseudouridine(2604) synthase RluF, partial [Clostridia bacterium]|nr:23S rRNA pseudouridine(2604) synthase RluF [Clostridia bacterium]